MGGCDERYEGADSTHTDLLLERAAGGDEDAFARLFTRYREALGRMINLRLTRELTRRCDASDVIQETYLEAFRRLDDFLRRRPMPFSVWLERTALEKLRDLRRFHVQTEKRSVRRENHGGDPSSIQLARSLLAVGKSPSGVVAAAEHAQQIEQALADSSDNDREILLMRYVEGRPNREAAQLLGITEKAASKRHGAALLRLRESMKRLYPDPQSHDS